jgi:hypothetical protein
VLLFAEGVAGDLLDRLGFGLVAGEQDDAGDGAGALRVGHAADVLRRDLFLRVI